MFNVASRHATSVMALVGILFLQGCASVYKQHNEPISEINYSKGYHLNSEERTNHAAGSYNVTLSFSGGGTRAAALSYGVLQELRDTTIQSRDKTVRLLDEVDSISSVSGGSFTAAYYGLFGDKIFEDYEYDFLNQSVQGALLRKMLNPGYWWRSLFTGFDRTEMAIEYYDQNIFKGKTFGDIPLDKRPYIEINATDLGTGNRFSFTQEMFDLICADLDTFSVARAVTASSAVPVAFPPIVIKNFAGTCGLDETAVAERYRLETAPSDDEQALTDRILALQDVESSTYLHLVDGGISDNLGLRAIMDRVVAMGGIVESMEKSNSTPEDILIILVNSAVAPKTTFSQTPQKPSIGETVGALSSTQIDLYTKATLKRIKDLLKEYETALAKTDTPLTFYFVELEFMDFSEPSMKDYFNSLPTTLELSKDEVDLLILAGRRLLRDNPEYQKFLKANGGELTIAKELLRCNRLVNPLCIW